MILNWNGRRETVECFELRPYPQFMWLMMHSYVVLTDSGGVQEEAPSRRHLGKVQHARQRSDGAGR